MSALARLLRPLHWSKNAVVLAPALFAGLFADAEALTRALAATGVFCLLASAIYAFNDAHDARWDRLHPAKRSRPVAAGLISPTLALALAVGLAAAGLLGARALDVSTRAADADHIHVFTGCALYLGLNVAYTLVLKRVPFVDLVCLAAGLVLRALVGAAVLSLVPSFWLVVCCFCLALFLAAGKRRLEVSKLGVDGALAARPLLAGYSRSVLDSVLVATAIATSASYVTYTLSPITAAKMGGRGLIVTTPFVLFAVARYARLVLDERGHDPVALLIGDRAILAAGLLWTATAAAVVYGPW